MGGSSTTGACAEAVEASADRIGIGSMVELDRTGRPEIWRIVDAPSDPDGGVINSDTPLARALAGAEVGDRVVYRAAGREWVVRVHRIVNSK